MKHLFYLVFLVLLSFSCDKQEDCPEGFTGDNCDLEIQPTSFVIRSIVVTSWPSLDASGMAWDFDSGPDLFVRVVSFTKNAVLFTSPIYEDVQPVNTANWTTSIEYANDEIVYVEVWDDDGGITAADDIGTCHTPYWMATEGFPAVQTLTNDGIIITYQVDYRF